MVDTMWLLLSPLSHEAHNILCVMPQNNWNSRDSLPGCIFFFSHNASIIMKCVNKFPKYCKDNHFMKGMSIYIFIDIVIYSEEESLNDKFVALDEDLGFSV